MSERASLLPLREIREAAQAYADVTERTGPYSVVTPAAVLALVDIAEAAHRANIQAPCDACIASGKDDIDCANVRLLDALARFDHA